MSSDDVWSTTSVDTCPCHARCTDAKYDMRMPAQLVREFSVGRKLFLSGWKSMPFWLTVCLWTISCHFGSLLVKLAHLSSLALNFG